MGEIRNFQGCVLWLDGASTAERTKNRNRSTIGPLLGNWFSSTCQGSVEIMVLRYPFHGRDR